MHYNGMAKLDQRAYGFVTEADPYRKQEFVYVYYDSVGVPALAKSFAADYKSIVFVLPRLLPSLLV